MSTIIDNFDSITKPTKKDYEPKVKKAPKLTKFSAIGVAAIALVGSALISYPFVTINHGIYKDVSVQNSLEILAVDYVNIGLLSSNADARELAFNNKFKHNQILMGSDFITKSENELGKKNREEVSQILKDNNAFEDGEKFKTVYKNLEDSIKLQKEHKVNPNPDVRDSNFMASKKIKKVNLDEKSLKPYKEKIEQFRKKFITNGMNNDITPKFK